MICNECRMSHSYQTEELLCDNKKNCDEVYQQGQVDGAKKFAEWLTNYAFDHIDYVCNGHFINRQGRQISVDEILAEWKKGEEVDK